MREMKLLFFIMLLISLTDQSYGKSRRAFFYSESIDNFTILDQVSNWSPLHNKAYKENFEKDFGLNRSDISLLSNYKNIRDKYLIKPKVDHHHLFPRKSIYLDTFSRAFFTADTMSEAFKNLKEVVNDNEYKFLIKFYNHFLDKNKKWRRESQSFHNHLRNFEKKFKKGKGPQIVKKLVKFLNLDKKEFRKVYYSFAWAPEFEKTTVEFMSNILLIKINPINKMANPDFTVIMSEIVEALLEAQSENQKIAFSSQFLKNCKIIKMPASLVFKWPFSIAAGAMTFNSNLNKKEFRLANEWSKNPWVQSYSQLIFSLLEKSLKRRDHLMGQVLNEFGSSCQDLINLSDFLFDISRSPTKEKVIDDN